MKTILLICRLFVVVILFGFHLPAFANSNSGGGDGGAGNDGTGGDNGAGDYGGDGGTQNTGQSGWSLGSEDNPQGGNVVFVPAADVAAQLDSTGRAHAGSPLYFTANYSMPYPELEQLMITVIAPDGTRQVQTMDLTGQWLYNYSWTTCFNLSTPGTYYAFAAVGDASYYGEWWYQDVATESTDGAVTWEPSVLLQTYTTQYGYSTPAAIAYFASHGLLPLDSGNGNQISFYVDGGTHADTVTAQTLPKPGLELWFQPSNIVTKTFQVIGGPDGPTNPAPPF
jgi:hypothetical protein